jgi:hypothetical protein
VLEKKKKKKKEKRKKKLGLPACPEEDNVVGRSGRRVFHRVSETQQKQPRPASASLQIAIANCE